MAANYDAKISELNRKIIELENGKTELTANAEGFYEKFDSLKSLFSSIGSTLADTEDSILSQSISEIISKAGPNIESAMETVKGKVTSTIQKVEEDISRMKSQIVDLKNQKDKEDSGE